MTTNGPTNGMAEKNGSKRKQDDAELTMAPPQGKQLKKNISACSSAPSAGDIEFDEALHGLELPPATPPMSPYTSCFKPTVVQGTKYIIVSGGVCSSLGKGVTTSSIGALLRGEGYQVTAIKMDPYLNPDAGLMSPFEHGEVYVLDDGGETDLDLGNYERMIGLNLARDNNITTGKIYQHVIEKERRGDYLGKTVQVVPHITGAMMEWIDRVAQRPVDGSPTKPQICLIELGGTVGDIESMPFIEALRAFKNRLAEKDEHSFAWCHCSYVPEMCGQKTKPTQHSVKALLSAGIQADFIICRCAKELEESTRKKIANQCNIASSRILSAHDQKNLFHVVSVLAEQRIVKMLEITLGLESAPRLKVDSVWNREGWAKFARQVDIAEASETLSIAIVGKYNKGGEDAYQSLVCALHHAAVQLTRKLEVRWIDATDLEGTGQRQTETEEMLKACHGILVPGGFGDRGIKGKAWAAHLARVWKKPYFGICLGMQVALIQFAQDELRLADATSEEFDSQKKVSKNHIFEFMPEISKDTMGSNMRLGSRWVEFPRPGDSFCCSLYGGAPRIKERHRHRYEFNTNYKKAMEEKGMIFAGQDEKKERMDIVELPLSEHPFYLGVQFHPEYKSRPGMPSPPFYGFMAAACGPTVFKDVCESLKAKGPVSHWVPKLDEA
eukprot:CAMPEP_0178435660 /NCGR_PEP_ID=MMETSP0689_2-20121128/34043_1 /TAXON_ID=160604 /ORGANISM="Amphidinium massartii, Strain CS-259" /LENGTH=667 /DNA_ID=CAMNT_0020057741 /DNA_START=18 /DNA_END=2021 /DNA_ORIENTATION=-